MNVEIRGVRRRRFYTNQLRWHIAPKGSSGLCGQYVGERVQEKMFHISDQRPETDFVMHGVCSRCAKRAINGGLVLGCRTNKAVQ